MHSLFYGFLCLVLMVSGATSARSAELPAPEHVQINLHSTSATIRAGQAFTVIIEQLIEPEWHTYWKNPGDSGTPTNVTWILPDGGIAGALENPIPTRIPYGPLMNFGYSGRVLFSTTITPPDELTGETFTVTAKIDWLACKDICLPEGGTYTLVLPVTGGAPDVNHTITDILRDLTATHPVKADWRATYHDEGNQTLITFTPSVQAVEILNNGGRVEFFPEEWGVIQNADEQVLAFLDEGRAVLAIPKGDRDRAAVGTFSGLFVIHDGQGHRQGYETSLTPLIPVVAPSQPDQGGLREGPVTAAQADVSFIGAVALALLGGIILNLMPCVFPVLSLKILSLAQLSGAEKKHLRPHGLAYAAGVIVTFLVIAGLLMILQGAGSAVGWGFQLQQPIVIVLLAYLFTLIGFNLMGWFEIDLARYIPARFHGHHDGLVGSFSTGILATLVATPCTAPFMAAAIGYALTQHPALGLAVFSSLGLGLALPFVILTFIPHFHAYLPRPGAWMVTLRQALAFPMFIAALWLIWVLGHQTGSNGTTMALSGILVIGFMLWLYRLTPGTKGRLRVRNSLMALSVIGLGALIVAQNCDCKPSVPVTALAAQTAYTPMGLEQALATDRPVFVNMTAAWCITCKVNERVALSTPATRDLFARRNVLYLVGDWTNYDADITSYLNQFGRKGVPLYVFYPAPDSVTGKRPDPVMLPQLLTPGLVAATLEGEKK